MNSDKSKFREVLVDVAEYDKDGNVIPFDSLSSGGARNADGSLITQYRNPRLPEPADEPETNPEFDEWLNREYDARRRREEEAEDRRVKEYAEIANLVVDNFVKPYAQQVVIPRATELWNTKVLPGGKRLAQRWIRPKRSQPEVAHVSGDTPEFAVETAKPLATKHNIDHTVEVSAVQSGAEDTPLVGVIIDEYRAVEPPRDSAAFDFMEHWADVRPTENRQSHP
ncbi:hypothetical protein LR392_05800 [Arthrobacter sp. AK04]|uniref:hypothetical protein n=1 Tax=Arthrobacter sp. AK04 TaxID=2900048 RepID=UPI001E527FCE|nr:hypothetical protein [Arthrobacter sp. AK04]MCD5341740.1 hypothetical protein [Arthrobacter sp. AK04]